MSLQAHSQDLALMALAKCIKERRKEQTRRYIIQDDPCLSDLPKNLSLLRESLPLGLYCRPSTYPRLHSLRRCRRAISNANVFNPLLVATSFHLVPFHSHRDMRSSIKAPATGKFLFEAPWSRSKIESISRIDVTLAPATLNGKKNKTGDKFVVFMANAVFVRIMSM